MTWIIFQIFITTLSGIIIPDSVRLPESTLVPPAEVIQAYADEPKLGPEQEFPPEYIIIPSIGVNAAVEYVELTERGAIDVPSGPDLIGWFSRSAIPGERGTAIVDGHRGWRNDMDAIFDRLNQVAIDDIVIVVNSRGESIPFIVYDIKTYLPGASPAEVFSNDEDGIFMNLITCDGDWDTELGTATKRLVVFTKKMETEQ